MARTPSEAVDLRAERRALCEEAGLSGPAFCRAYAAAADRWLVSLLDDEPGVALVAVGGYGRGELAPFSDLDVVLVHDGRRDVKQVADRIWYPIWDAGVGLDHSVRTVKEAVAVAGDDLKAALGLLDARFVAGDARLADELRRKAAEQWAKRSGRWLSELGRSVRARHDEFDEVAFLLEPELKEGRGGLRDVHALRVLAMTTAVAGAFDPAVDQAYDLLVHVRVALHRRAERALDRLLLQEQDGVAADLGYRHADALMADVSAAARTVAWAGDETWARVLRPRKTVKDRALGPGLALRDGEVVLTADASPATDPTLVLRAGVAAASTGARLSRPSLDRLAAEAVAPPEPWPADVREALVALLGAGHAAVPILEALDQKGLIVRLMPEWANVRCRPQRNAYHRFTVDRHLCEAAANAAALTDRVARPDLLLLGAWLHDIGKGFPGDHTAVGMEVVARIGARMGLPPTDVDVLVAMVRLHLLLPDVATRRDLDDPATSATVAAEVGDRATLELLAALTEADSLATGPSAWGTWKAGLVAELVARAAHRLDGGDGIGGAGGTSLPTADHQALMAQRRLIVDVDGERLTVIAPDRPGLFARVAGSLALHGLDVRSAAVASSDDGMAVEVFELDPGVRAPDWTRVKGDIERALSGRLALDARLAERARVYARRRPAAALPTEPRVTFDNDATDAATVVEVRALDGVGVLYRITRTLADADLDVRRAKVSTLGHEVIDAFYVVDSGGRKVTDREHLVEVERAVLDALTRR
ncbi:MAG: [protein-PII] uridylyltransferase [Actinobacteria bacterium]|nr:[protein-PII] uridylyltransferase [Actinomycetota bacterium]